MPYNPMMAMTNAQMRDQNMRSALQDFMGYFQSLKAQKDDAEKEGLMNQISAAPASTTGAAGGPQLGMDAAGMPTGIANGPQGASNAQALAAAKAKYAMKYGVKPYSAQDIANEDAVSAEKPKQAALQTTALGQENTQRGQAIDLTNQLNPLKVDQAKTEAQSGALDLSQKQALGPLQLTEAKNKALASGYAPAQAAANVAATEASATNGKYAPVTLSGNRLGILDTRHGRVSDTGEEVQPKNVSAQTLQNAQGKLTTLAVMRKQLQDVQDHFDKIKGGASSGKLTGWVPTEKGEQFDKAVAALKQTARQLTRTPGEGSMSDYETKLSQLSLPNRHDYDSVTQQSIDQLGDMVNLIESGYKNMMPAPKASPANLDDADMALINKYKNAGK